MDKRQVARPVGADDQDAAARCPQNEMPHPVGWGYDIGGGGQPGTSVPPRDQLSPRGKMKFHQRERRDLNPRSPA